MLGKIALEEHFAISETLQDSAGFVPDSYWTELSSRLMDIHDRRLSEMDKHGIEMSILSLNAPAVQAIPNVSHAIDVARRANDYLAEQVSLRPDRFQGFAALPMQDPEAATEELTRCVKELGFRGALVNGFLRWKAVMNRFTTTCLNTGNFGSRLKRWVCLFICIRVIPYRNIRRFMKDTPG